MTTLNRRYDIDWLRVIAIGLLLIYHVAIGFQPWGLMIGFITNSDPWTSLWLPMSMLNVWRIPFLFFVSGMGVYFAMRKRSMPALIGERSLRILVPFLFGAACIFPVSSFILNWHYGWDYQYVAHPGHLWFLGNIFIYVLALSPLFYYLKRNENGRIVMAMRRMLRTPLGLIPFLALFVLEAFVMKPFPYELYAMTWHGFVLGFLAFLSGYCLVIGGDPFWQMLLRWRWLFIVIAIGLFTVRLTLFGVNTPAYLLAIESQAWILTVFAFGHKYLNRNARALSYLSEAAYPVYILHMIFLALGSSLIFPLQINVAVKFFAVLFFTLGGCFAAYEVIRRIFFLRPLFGLRVGGMKAERSLNHSVQPESSQQ